MSSKFFGNKQDKSLPKKQGKANNKGKGAQKQVRKVGRGK
jgi:hypothetical protein